MVYCDVASTDSWSLRSYEAEKTDLLEERERERVAGLLCEDGDKGKEMINVVMGRN